MGIFSLFGKNNRLSSDAPATTPNTTRDDTVRAETLSRPVQQRNTRDHNDAGNTTIQTATASTSMKIDAIESEMSSEFMYLSAANSSVLGNSTKIGNTNDINLEATHVTIPMQYASKKSKAESSDLNTQGNPIEVTVSETLAVIEEAAVLFANQQTEIAEHLLCQAVEDDDLGNSAHTVWSMLLDIYQISGKQQEFEDLSVAYANKFASSPPAWNDQLSIVSTSQKKGDAGSTPAVSFSGKLDASITKQLERVQKLSLTNTVLKLEFTRIQSVDSIGCGLLLRTLQRLQKLGLELVLVGAADLAKKIQAILQVGRRDETATPWLLLLELHAMLNQELAFEDTSIDYSITFEVSPPPFVPPVTKITAEQNTDSKNENTVSGGYMALPVVIEGHPGELLTQIQTYANLQQPAIIDCSRLARVDFSAAGQLLNGLLLLSSEGKHIEFHHVNHLVIALFKVMGMQDIVRIYPRKS
ncbi:STAS domain-containing protein [Glaciimonas soli]|uniref:STAS domain-containing protein n=1 Tax=Glaciimonas soli TaxID=2590999 RepID=A0A843YSF6_9BURK|nr:STAS domain-containing protein [Glaciimonas soli]MQR00291.1 hypothetical protein [Glaciimonas soli]